MQFDILKCYNYNFTAGESTFNNGTHREYRSKPLKHSIVERILVFLSTKNYSSVRICCWKSSAPKMIGIKTYLSIFQMFDNPSEAGKEEILQQMFRKF